MSHWIAIILVLLLGLVPAPSWAGPLSPAQACEADDVGDGSKQDGVAWLGVNVRPIDSELAARLGLSEVIGVFVEEVTPNSPAAASGLEVGEVILSIKGREVRDPDDLAQLVQQHSPGDALLLRVAHGTDRLFRAVRLGAKPRAPRQSVNGDRRSELMRPPVAKSVPNRGQVNPCPLMVDCGNGTCCPQGTRCSGDRCVSLERCPGMKYCGNDACCPIGTQCCLTGGNRASCCPSGTQCRADRRGEYYCWRP